jgi:hypothetical protein
LLAVVIGVFAGILIRASKVKQLASSISMVSNYAALGQNGAKGPIKSVLFGNGIFFPVQVLLRRSSPGRRVHPESGTTLAGEPDGLIAEAAVYDQWSIGSFMALGMPGDAITAVMWQTPCTAA